jgi:hypothetical protein
MILLLAGASVLAASGAYALDCMGPVDLQKVPVIVSLKINDFPYCWRRVKSMCNWQ